MKIQQISAQAIQNRGLVQNRNNNINNTNRVNGNVTNPNYAKTPLGFTFGAIIIPEADKKKFVEDNNGEYFDPRRHFPDTSRYKFLHTSEDKLKLLDDACKHFTEIVDTSELFDQSCPEFLELPLKGPHEMDEFIKISSVYTQYKENPIICLGRSPKWFLNANLWTKGGIEDYTFIPFSGYWHRHDREEGMIRIQRAFPTEQEENAYHDFLLRKKVDPKTIIDHFHETGKKTIITDYICSSKGACSFLDTLARLGVKQGVSMEEFARSIKFVGIGSMDYMTSRIRGYAFEDTVSTPEVLMPEDLKPHWRILEQEYHDMDRDVFDGMLLNQNTNECRSTYYPHTMWTKYDPEEIKIGFNQAPDARLREIIEGARGPEKKCSIFTPAMFDFRNGTIHKILRGLQERNLLKKTFKSGAKVL